MLALPLNKINVRYKLHVGVVTMAGGDEGGGRGAGAREEDNCPPFGNPQPVGIFCRSWILLLLIVNC